MFPTINKNLSGSLEASGSARFIETPQGAGGIGGLLARSQGTNHAYYHADANGNIVYMFDQNQAMVATYRYDPFGNTISQSGSLADANHYRFSSKEIDDTGMYYYLYRFYDPNLQRWINRDPRAELGFELAVLGISAVPSEDPNLYAFLINNPIDDNDPLGLVGGRTAQAGDRCCLEMRKAWKVQGYQCLSDCINKTRGPYSTGWLGTIVGGTSSFWARFLTAAGYTKGGAIAAIPSAFLAGYEGTLAFGALIDCDAGVCIRHGKLRKVGRQLDCQ